MTEDRCQRTEDGEQGSEVGSRDAGFGLKGQTDF
jgi:hypothetical protein